MQWSFEIRPEKNSIEKQNNQNDEMTVKTRNQENNKWCSHVCYRYRKNTSSKVKIIKLFCNKGKYMRYMEYNSIRKKD